MRRLGSMWWSLCLAVLLAGCGVAASHPTPRPKHPARPFRVLAFWAQGTDVTLAPLGKESKAITAFVPFFYSISPSGAIINRVDPTVLSQVRRLGIPVVPLFNTPGSQAFLGSIPSRLLVARAIASLVRSQHYQGVDIDFEPAAPQYAAGLAAFIIDLHDFLPTGSQLYLDVIPASGSAYRFAQITPEVTGYVYMTYDEHDDGSLPGPVAATNWVKAKLTRFLSVVPANKILLGIAFYGYDWIGGGTHAITISLNAIPPEALKVARYDPVSQEMHAVYTDSSGTLHDLWWETPQGIAAKMNLAEDNHLQGVAIWRFGYQTPALTKMLTGVQTLRRRPFRLRRSPPPHRRPHKVAHPALG
jgi:spore germination protein